MNVNVYGSIYGRFHNCAVSSVQKNIIVLNFVDLPWEPWYVKRCYPSKKVIVDSERPFLQALKSFYKSDAVTSVFNAERTWSALLGKERLVIPASKEMATVHVYATPLFVRNAEWMSQYLEGTVRPAFDGVYMYKGTVMYLDQYDIPYPGGWYFDPGQTANSYYRICFLTNKPLDYVSELVHEWKARREILSIPYLTRVAHSFPKWVDFRPELGLSVAHPDTMTKVIIHKPLSEKYTHLLIQDVLNSFHHNVSRQEDSSNALKNLGLLIEWPFVLKFEGSRTEMNVEEPKKYVALSVNGNHPTRVIHAQFPYESYQESHQVPATRWTAILYTRFPLTTSLEIEKVVLESTVVGFAYRGVFFCLSYPLLEGRPHVSSLASQTKYLAHTAKFTEPDSRVKILETIAYNSRYSLHRARLQEVPHEVWCLTESDSMHPRPARYDFPPLVKQWLEWFAEMEGSPTLEDVDTNLIRTVLTLAKHDICFELVPDSKKQDLDEKKGKIVVYTKGEIVDFINGARLQRHRPPEEQEEGGCAIA